MKGFFFKSVGVPGGSPELGKGNSGWVPSNTHERIIVWFLFPGGPLSDTKMEIPMSID